MSETTPPPAQTTGPSLEESDAGQDTPPPPPPADPHADDTTPPAPRKSRKGLIIVAAVVVLALVAGAVVGAVALFGSDAHKIVTPATAGDMKRDKAYESKVEVQLDEAEKQFRSQAKGVSYVRSAAYDQTDTKRGPKGALVFLGAKLKKEQSPAAFVKSFGKQAGSNGFKITNVSAGGDDAKGVCAAQEQQGQKIAICAWATKDSMGEVVPTVAGWDAAKLATVMRDLRPDVEKSE